MPAIIQSLFSVRRVVAAAGPLVEISDMSLTPIGGGNNWRGYGLETDGSIIIMGNGDNWRSAGTDWKLSGAVGDYEVYFHYSQSWDSTAFPNGGALEWVSLDTLRYFQSGATYTNFIIGVDIRLASTKEVLDTATITLTV